MTDFRLLVTPLIGDDVVATATLALSMDGTTDGSVRIWSIPAGTSQVELETVLDHGGRRLALCRSSEGMVIVAGAWERHGICGYDARTGERLWQRRDLKKVQSLTPARGDAVAACFDMRPMHILDVAAGATIATVRGVRRFWQCPFEPIGVGEVLGHVAGIGNDDWTLRWRVPVGGFGLLDAVFAPDAVLVSNTVDGDSGEACSVYCISLSGEILWQRLVQAETNVPWLGWDAEADQWLGISHHVEKMEPETLMRWSRDGDLVSRLPLGRNVEYAILPGGKVLVTGRGDVVDTTVARNVRRLAEPHQVARSD